MTTAAQKETARKAAIAADHAAQDVARLDPYPVYVTDAELDAAGGGAVAGTPVVRAFAFAYNTANILTGHAVYTPTIGDVLLEAWVEIVTAWDGTTPTGDVGPFLAGDNHNGYLDSMGYGPIDMSAADTPRAGLRVQTGLHRSDVRQSIFSNNSSDGGRNMPASFATADPIKVCVSQNGQDDGDDPASTQGAAILYLVTVTPA